MGCSNSKEATVAVDAPPAPKFDGKKMLRRGTQRSLTAAMPNALWLNRIKALDQTLECENRVLDQQDATEVLSVFQALIDEANDLDFDIDTRFSHLYSKQWWFDSKNLQMCAHQYHPKIPDNLFMPHTHPRNFYTLCVRGGYRHILYQCKPADGENPPWYYAGRPGGLVAGEQVVTPAQPTGTVLEVDDHMHSVGKVMYLDRHVIHDVRPSPDCITILIFSKSTTEPYFYTPQDSIAWGDLKEPPVDVVDREKTTDAMVQVMRTELNKLASAAPLKLTYEIMLDRYSPEPAHRTEQTFGQGAMASEEELRMFLHRRGVAMDGCAAGAIAELWRKVQDGKATLIVAEGQVLCCQGTDTVPVTEVLCVQPPSVSSLPPGPLGDRPGCHRSLDYMYARLSMADAVASKLHDFELAFMAYLETVEGGKAVVPKPGPVSGSALPLQLGKISVGDEQAIASLPEPHGFPQIPDFGADSAEGKALAQVLRHTVPVGDDWDYYLLVNRKDEWEPALLTGRVVTARYLAEELFFLKGCHLLAGAGSLQTVLKRLATGVLSEDELDAKLAGWLVVQVDVRRIKRDFCIPVIAEVLHLNKPDGTPHPDWDDTIHPHIFGPLPLAAVLRTAPVVRGSTDGHAVMLGEFTDFPSTSGVTQ